MIRFALAAALASIMATASASAQPAASSVPPAVPAGPCQALLQSLPVLTVEPQGVVENGVDGCQFKGVALALGSRFGYRAAMVLEHGLPPGPLQVPTRPIEVRIEARDITFFVHSGSARTDWMSQQQQVPFDMVLGFAYDPGTKGLALREFSMTGRSIGRVGLTGLATGVSEQGFPQGVGLQALDLHLDSRRFIPVFLLSALVPLLPDTDPAAAVEQGKTQAAALSRALLPQAGATAETVQAITGFIADFPHPQHVFDLQVTATPPVTPDTAQQAAASPAAMAALLKTLAVRATYSGDAH